jgi:hypothetical protein
VPLGFSGAALHRVFGKSASYQPAGGGADLDTTVRIKGASAAVTRSRRQIRTTTTVDIFLLVSVVADQPRKGSVIQVASGDAFAGRYVLDADAEPQESGEWRCPSVRDSVNNTMHSGGGAPRPRI